MKAKVDKSGCISCGMCVAIAPEVFRFDENEKSEAYGEVSAALEQKTQEAADNCPVAVIEIY